MIIINNTLVEFALSYTVPISFLQIEDNKICSIT